MTIKRTALALLTAAFVISFSPTAPATPNPTPARAVAAAAAPPQAHPEIREAIASLRRAKDHLEHAKHDFGGHRVEAIKATDEAIRQLETCLKYE